MKCVVALLAALLLTGCVSFGPTISASKDLGYANPSVGLAVVSEGRAGRVEGRYLRSEKRDGGEGTALAAHALLRVLDTQRVDLLVGVDGAWQWFERYDTERLSPRVDVEFLDRFGLYWVGPDRKIKYVYGVRVEHRFDRSSLLFDVAHARHDQGDGERVSLSYVYRSKR